VYYTGFNILFSNVKQSKWKARICDGYYCTIVQLEQSCNLAKAFHLTADHGEVEEDEKDSSLKNFTKSSETRNK
jgi:hypothetical protein